MTDNENSPFMRLRDRMKDAQAELEKVNPPVTSENAGGASSPDVERMMRLRDANREMMKVLGS